MSLQRIQQPVTAERAESRLDDAPWRPSRRDRDGRTTGRVRPTPTWLRWLRARGAHWDRLVSGLPRARIRWRRLWISLLAVAVLTAAGWGWHRWQLARQASTLLEVARRQAAAGEHLEAARLFDAYLRLFPQELSVRVERAKAFDAQAVTLADRLRSIELYRQGLAAKQDLLAVHCRLAELEFELGRDNRALQHAEAATQLRPDDARAWKMRALAEARRFVRAADAPSAPAMEALARAAELNPADVPVLATYAGLLRSQGEHWHTPAMIEQADAVMNGLIGQRPTDPQVWLARYSYRMKFGLEDADGDLDEALAHAKDDLEVLLAAARRAADQSQWSAAEGLFRKAIETAPASGRGYIGLAQSLHAQGRRREAIQVARQGLEHSPGDLWLTVQLAEWLLLEGQGVEAENQLENLAARLRAQGAGLPPAQAAGLHTSLEYLRARCLMARGDFAAALTRLAPLTVSKLSPTGWSDEMQTPVAAAVRVHYSRAESFAALDDWSAAGTELDAAALLEPGSAVHLVNAGQAWEKARPDRAVQRYERALAIDPQLAAVRQRLEVLQQTIAPGQFTPARGGGRR